MARRKKREKKDVKKETVVRINNREFAATDTIFKNACEQATIMIPTKQAIMPTTRQASKYRRKMGAAHFFAFMNAK
jgi:hypothetical protein